MNIETLSLREVIVFLVAAGIVVPLVRRLKISPVLSFLVVGLVIGPHGLARFVDVLPWLGYAAIADLEGVRALAELGVVFLLFMIGLELSVNRLWAMRRLVFGLGGAQVVLTGAVIAAIAFQFDNTLPVATVLGAGFALSSTAIVMQVLAESRRLGTRTGRTGFSILLFQDLAVVPILFLVAAFAEQSDGSVALAFVWAIGQALIAVTVILVIGRLVIRPLFRIVGSAASREMFLALVLLVIIGTALVTEKAGLSMALGAFLAGLLFAETEYRHAIEVDIEPFKGLLLGLFFVSVGMSIDIAQVAANPLWLIASVFGLFLIKSPVVYVLARLFNEPRSVALEAALLLGQGGEFAFVIFGMAYGLGLMPGDTAQFMLIVAGMTMIATPPVAHAARRMARAIETWEASHGEPDADMPAGLAGHVVVVGYGRVGQMLGSLLDTQELPHVALDIDASLVARFRAAGANIFFGDASQPEMLRKFGAEEAAALVVTMDSPKAAESVVTAARQRWPDLTIYARARDIGHATRLIALGASHAVPETTEASLQLSEMVLTGAGVPDHAARQITEVRRKAEQAAVDESRRRQGG
ncbi:MAG: monovalent cation:proton antiporter-2 (CPA2) family protein [Alphaproteobacteria bacterium]|nr:monovalent cation:proton antiporter-2 (CPA2) family protein [Alphaproteobacteria bacterium]